MTPLSHHEILRHVGPFAQVSRHVDLARSDRAARVLTFKPVAHTVTLEGVAPVQVTERLRLNLSRPVPRLRRTVSIADGPVLDGLEATLSARGADLEALLERTLCVPVATHFRVAAGTLIADSYRCPDDPELPLVLRESRARVDGFEVVLDARTVVGEPLTGTLTSLELNARHSLPEDLVAVLGHAWSVLTEKDHGWTFLLRVPAREPRRSKVTLARFEQTVTHLTDVLTSGPTGFHAAHRSARWQVWLRRLMPLIIIVAMLGSLPLLDRFVFDENTSMHPLALGLPNLLILAFLYLSRHEMPSIGIPPLPRPLKPSAWSPVVVARRSSSEPSPENRAHG